MCADNCRSCSYTTGEVMGLNNTFPYTNFTLSALHFNYSYIHDWDNGLMPCPDNWKLQLTLYTISWMTSLSLGVPLNLLTIITISRGKHTGKEVKIELINLAVADLVSAATIPISLMRQIKFPQSDIFCKIFMAVVHGTFGVSTLWNMTISLERVVIYYFPLKARRYRYKQKLIVAACVWCVGIMINVENILYAKSHRRKCVMVMTGIPEERIGWLMALRWCIPIPIIVISYLLIGIKMCLKHKIGEKGTDRQEVQAHKRKIQVYRMLAVDASVTVTTWLPYCILNITYAGRVFGAFDVAEARRAILLVDVLGGLLMTNIFSSPIIYFVCSQSIRKDVRVLFNDLAQQFSVTSTTSDFNNTTELTTTTDFSSSNLHGDNSPAISTKTEKASYSVLNIKRCNTYL